MEPVVFHTRRRVESDWIARLSWPELRAYLEQYAPEQVAAFRLLMETALRREVQMRGLTPIQQMKS